MHPISFIPGPSSLYFTVQDHIKASFKSGILEASHRSQFFKNTYQETVESIRTLMDVPSNFEIVFTASATEVWERSLQNLVNKKTLHLVNGAFSKRYYDFAKTLKYDAQKVDAPLGSCVNYEDLPEDEGYELVSLVLNESSTGAMYTNEDIKKIRKKYPNALIAIDGVSSVPYNDLDFNDFDFLYLSVQKCFGLPAGLGVWFVNDKCLEKHQTLKANGKITGTYHDLGTMVEKGKAFQTVETPNVLNIYLLGKVCQDMISKTLVQIRREINYKAAVLYQTTNDYDFLTPFVKEQNWQSKTVIVLETDRSQALIDFFLKRKMLIAGGYGSNKANHIRIANFPTHSKESVELLVDSLQSF